MSTAAVQARVRELGAARAPLRVVGRGGWLDAGRPVTDATPLALTGDDAIIEYVPGDLTLTARAGATLNDIARATGAEGQWLALDPYGSGHGTLGATIATGSAGTLAHAFGAPRDVVLGVEGVTGTGAIVRGGGRVVKNVAGFDLTRLFTGAWGTLAVITEATVRLRARPERDETIALPLPTGDELDAWLVRLRALPFSPLALELLNAPLASALRLGDAPLLLARLGGNEHAVRAQLLAIQSFGDATTVAGATWSALREIEPPHAAVARVSAPQTRLHALWSQLATGDAGSFAHAAVARGVVRCIHASDRSASVSAWLERISHCEGTRIFERLPAELWGSVPSRVDDPLSRAVRDAFDPHRILNRGILGELA